MRLRVKVTCSCGCHYEFERPFIVDHNNPVCPNCGYPLDTSTLSGLAGMIENAKKISPESESRIKVSLIKQKDPD